MVAKRFSLRARVSTDNPTAVRRLLFQSVTGASVKSTDDPQELLVEGRMAGASARDLNRSLLTALRRVEKRTRLRSEWTIEESTERFFDYVPKGKRRAPPNPPAQS